MKHLRSLKYNGGHPSRHLRTALPLLFLLPVVISCGGGDVTLAGGGIGGSGYTSVGTVTALGSIFVNGIEFQTTGAAVSLNGAAANENELQVGMFVKLEGIVNPDGKTGKADTVVFDPNVVGPVSSIDLGRNVLEVMGQTVLVDAQTAIAGRPGNSSGLSGIAVNDRVEISGMIDADGTIKATRIAWKTVGQPAEVNGRISNLTSTTFRINNLTIDFSKLAPSGIRPADCVTVRGNLVSSTLLQADSIEKKSIDIADNAGLEMEGFATGLSYSGMGMGGFSIYTPYGHQRVEFNPSTRCTGGRIDSIKAGTRLKVQGTTINNTIQARQMVMM